MIPFYYLSMKSLKESLFDKDLIKRDLPNEYLYGLVKYIDFISHRGAYDGIPKYIYDYFDVDAIEKEFKKVTKKFELQDWTEYNPDRADGYSYAVPQKNKYKEFVRQLIYVIVCNIKTTKVINSIGEIVLSKLQREVNELVKKYKTKYAVRFNLLGFRSMVQFETLIGTEDSVEKHFFKIMFNELCEAW